LSVLSHAAATLRLHDVLLGRSNRRIVDCWLAQWRSDALPEWTTFSIEPVQELKPGIVVFKLYPDGRLICISCGEHIRRLAGLDLTGKDWVALALPEQRAGRLAAYRNVAGGAVAHSLRYGEHASGEVHYIQEILLPFAETAEGVVPVMAHLGWRPAETGPADGGEFRNSRAIPDEFQLISLRA
jgi:hypothetical protein